MPSLVRKLLIFTAVDGLILQPALPRHHAPATQQAITVDYKGSVGPLLRDRLEEEIAPASLETHGIVGLIQVATSFFLIAICAREQVAQIRGKPVYRVTDVALIPLSSQAAANTAIAGARQHAQRRPKSQLASDNDIDTDTDTDTDTGSDDEAPSVTDSLIDDDAAHTAASTDAPDPVTGQQQQQPNKPGSSVAADVIQRKGVYGRFAEKWFSKKGWSADSRRTQGLTSPELPAANDVPRNVESTPKDADQPASASKQDTLPTSDDNAPDRVRPEEIPQALQGHKDAATVALLPKILQTTRMYFSSGNFYFSYDYDISHGVADQQVNTSLPLFKQFDPLFFWNQHIVAPFVDAGQHAFVLPLMQGFVGQRPFTIKIADTRSNSVMIDPSATPNDIQLQSWHEKQKESVDADEEAITPEPSNGEDFLLTLVSRRSVKRAGLRYLRRGTDDEGFTANSVETEQILSSPTWNISHDKIFSYTQFRGSIPLFFSQSPYSLKPQVNTWGTFETNAEAFKRHFTELSSRYGDVYCDSLVDKHATEAKIGELYEKHAKNLNENGGLDGKGKQLGFEWFDFHNICRGMHFENVSVLIETLAPFTKSAGWTEIAQGQIQHKQSGVVRTNCMDCLDRTNVVQSACARTALEAQLSAGSFTIDLQNDPSTSWFNTLWADNGDAISRQYAGTAALKGDFTRTRKRQITGALTDFGLTLTRYYNNIVNDYFTQALIDYLLGRATDTIFAEFEADMKSSDYFIDMRKVRQQAIDRSAGIVIEDHEEDLVHGWTLSVPTAANLVKTATFEEAVLLLTNKALYFCRLDWGTEKVREFERIQLGNIQGVMRGVYITSTLAQRHTDEDKNVGFVVRYKTQSNGKLVRRNTRALDSSAISGSNHDENVKNDETTGRFLAFKALPRRSSVSASDTAGTTDQEGEVVKSICDDIVRLANKTSKDEALQRSVPDTVQEGLDVDGPSKELQVEEKDIISLADAKKSTGYLEQIEYSLKKLVWG